MLHEDRDEEFGSEKDQHAAKECHGPEQRNEDNDGNVAERITLWLQHGRNPNGAEVQANQSNQQENNAQKTMLPETPTLVATAPKVLEVGLGLDVSSSEWYTTAGFDA